MPLVAIIVFALTVAAAMAFPQVPKFPKHGQHGYDAKHYFQYANVNAPNVFEWGYRRGNDPNHFREEYLSQNNHNFKANSVIGPTRLYDRDRPFLYEILVNQLGPLTEGRVI